jgi:hypothetical protein
MEIEIFGHKKKTARNVWRSMGRMRTVDLGMFYNTPLSPHIILAFQILEKLD